VAATPLQAHFTLGKSMVSWPIDETNIDLSITKARKKENTKNKASKSNGSLTHGFISRVFVFRSFVIRIG
jgi:hypothetical protein